MRNEQGFEASFVYAVAAVALKHTSRWEPYNLSKVHNLTGSLVDL